MSIELYNENVQQHNNNGTVAMCDDNRTAYINAQVGRVYELK